MPHKAIKLFAITALTALLSASPAQCGDHKSLRGKALSSKVIKASVFDLEDQVVKITFPTGDVEQVSRTEYQINYGHGNDTIVVVIPVSVGKQWFGEGQNRRTPRNLFAKVTIGKLVNEFGKKFEGPVLMGLGTKIKRNIRGEVEFAW